MAKRTKTGKVTAVLMRVSSDDQRHDSQEHALKAYCQNHGITNVRWFREKVSGAADKRDVLADLDRAVFLGQVERIVVWKLDRVSRKGAADGCTRLGNWISKDVTVNSVTEQFDFTGAVGEMAAAIFFSVARMEREHIRQRIKAGMAAAKAKGKKLGRRKGTSPKWAPSKRRVDPQLARSLRDQGEPVKAIAERFGCTVQAVYAALRAV